MKTSRTTKSLITTFGAIAALCVASNAMAAPSGLIPLPAEMKMARGHFQVGNQTVVCVTNPSSQGTADYLKGLVKALRGIDLASGACGTSTITLDLDATAPVEAAEGYSLTVTAKGVVIQSRAEAGLFYGAVTLGQLLSPDDHFGQPVTLEGLSIKDYPQYAWRGLMIDSARHFLPVVDVKTMIDQMAQHKLNSLHLHLSDDQGWRVEIKRYPNLTRIGAWRTPPSNGGPGVPTEPYGGFYTQDDIRDLVAYAAARHITIVPEIDMPGHAQAAVASYPEIGIRDLRNGGDQPTVSTDWGVNPYLFNTDETSLAFIRNVLDEIMAIFPSTYIHVGGDEAVKNQWEKSPAIQAQIKALGLKDEHELQTWFIDQLGAYLNSKGRRLIGWDEILEGGIPQTAAIMSWRGTDGAIKAAQAGHDVVLSPTNPLYFDNQQSRRNDEPAARGWVVPLEDVYKFDAMPAVLTADQGKHVMGAQANLWSEYLMSGWYVQHAAFPRTDALAETLWSPKSTRNWKSFLTRLPVQMVRYRQQNIGASDAAFAVDFTTVDGRNVALASGKAKLALSNQVASGVIRYTLDGSEPTASSKVYNKPIDVTLGQTVIATAFTKDDLKLAGPDRYDFTAASLLTRTSQELTACGKGALGLRTPLTPDSPAKAPVYNIDIFDSCWMYPEVRRDGVTSVTIDIARLARNYGLANEASKVLTHPRNTPFGELVVYRDTCAGAEEARIPLTNPATTPNVTTLNATLPSVTGDHALCLIFTAPLDGPYYAIDTVRLNQK
ncbi:hypothetical protein AEAC466_16775 [Asticcacaulis sp. AC466]|uniref:beta-N-acetylhexosaminidase n=1 Tax=Asticcacaulis sp. AC466 TaxID=1282362 RepID=UPI0003C3EFD1|nr:family 20 glycosylhydrolase [Asticcacaulis sp. AC466]ESQ82519.1 hypothetical protein AEAC466_16775 [Asticcacaulis sp. AC466]